MVQRKMVGGTVLRQASNEDVVLLQGLLNEDSDNQVMSVYNGSDMLGETIFIIEYSGLAAGFCTYRSAADEIFPLVVFKDFRRKGIGAEAMRQLLEILKMHNVNEVGIEILPGAELFWESVFKGYAGRSYGGGKFTFNI